LERPARELPVIAQALSPAGSMISLWVVSGGTAGGVGAAPPVKRITCEQAVDAVAEPPPPPPRTPGRRTLAA